MTSPIAALDDIEHLRKLFVRYGARIRATAGDPVRIALGMAAPPPPWVAGQLFCPGCGGLRRMELTALYLPGQFPDSPAEAPPMAPGYVRHPRPPTEISPSAFSLRCVQCEAAALLVVCKRAGTEEAVVLPELAGGLGTPHTPDAIRHYLDEAQRSRSAGALSAAVAMYRVALDHLLYDHGYRDGMLGARINRLSEDVDAGTAPDWAKALDPAYFEVIKKLGNASLHTNDGTVSAQRHLDAELVLEVDELFLEVLDLVYERPAASRARLERLRARQEAMEDSGEAEGANA